MAHIGRQHLGVEEEGCRGNEVVGVVYPAMSSAVLARQRACGPRNVFVDRDPGDCREELLEHLELAFAHSGEELEPNNLAGGESLALLDESLQEIEGGLSASQMVYCN